MTEVRNTRSRRSNNRRRTMTPEEYRRYKRAKAMRQQRLRVRRNRLLIICAVVLMLGILAISGIVSTIRKSRQKKQQANTQLQTVTEVTEKQDEASEDEDIRLVMVGDVLLHDAINQYAKQEDGSYDYKSIFSAIKPEVQAADLALENQEVIIGGADLGVTGYPAFNAPFEVADDIADAGFNVILHANNHSLDKGIKAVKNCLEYWRTHHPNVAVLGMHESDIDAERIFVYRKGDIRVAILNYTQITNKNVDQKLQEYTLDSMSKDKIHEDVQLAREMADIVVVCPHWGTEYSLSIDKQQQEMTEFMLKEGVDLVIGTHPHVIEPIEMLEDQETGHKMLVYYSLGNITSWVLEDSQNIGYRVTSGMAQVIIGRLPDGKVGIKDYGINPLICHYTRDLDSVVVYPLDQYTDEMAKSHLVNTYTGKFDLDYVKNHFRNVWGDYKTLQMQ